MQNGSVSCIGVPSAVPSGIRAVLAENLICSSLDLECASSNDQTFTHSDMRRTARFLMQFLPGTDFISSGLFRCAELRQHVCWFKRRCCAKTSMITTSFSVT
ncbi:propanediol/glycerol family dehydratase large subunit [Escherichia coli]|uniref:propanediol/glycerol family dehydratase large subunit n=1 Tax=Escherichia coli TaxID=562 RepID=UPI0039880F67